jgi:type I restriction enzyme M protein
MNKTQGQLDFSEDAQTEHLDTAALETWLWDAACAIRGATDAPKFKDFILPLVFFKRLSDVFDDEFATQVEAFGSEEVAHDIIKADHADALKSGRTDPIVRFYIPREYQWERLRNHGSDGKLGEFVTTAMREVAKLNPDLRGIFDVQQLDYNARQAGQRVLGDEQLAKLIEVLSRHRLGLANAEPDILGRAYEYLLRKFAEGQGQSAGEFYTPKEVGWLMAYILDPGPFSTAYDPTCGSGGLLIKVRLHFEQQYEDKRTQAPKLYGQELNPVTFAMAKMNMFLHDFTDSHFAIGDTFRRPGFGAERAGLKQFDYVVANPMWNQDNYDDAFYDNDPWERFEHNPPGSTADWGWAQHILASLKETGRAAVVLDTGAVSRGSGSKNTSRERDIRKWFVENDWIEGVVLLPENLFYNTSAPGIILVLNRKKPKDREGEILLINASRLFEKGKPKNFLTEEAIRSVSKVFREWQEKESLSHKADLEAIRKTDYNLSPSLFVSVAESVEHRSIHAIVDDLTEARRSREEADEKLQGVLAALGIELPSQTQRGEA